MPNSAKMISTKYVSKPSMSTTNSRILLHAGVIPLEFGDEAALSLCSVAHRTYTRMQITSYTWWHAPADHIFSPNFTGWLVPFYLDVPWSPFNFSLVALRKIASISASANAERLCLCARPMRDAWSLHDSRTTANVPLPPLHKSHAIHFGGVSHQQNPGVAAPFQFARTFRSGQADLNAVSKFN